MTKVFYPDDVVTSRPAKWKGPVVAKKFLPPDPITIECGRSYFHDSFDNFKAIGMLPQIIETFPWTEMRSYGPVVIDPIEMYGWGDTYEYPAPITFFTGFSDLTIDQPVPGVSDICDVTKIPLGDLKEHVLITPDPLLNAYNTPHTLEQKYSWDTSSTPANELVELELEDAYISISCQSHWKYESTFELVYTVSDESAEVCGPGQLTRTLKVEGDFYVADDNKVFGNLSVDLPTVTYSGCVKGFFSGSKFNIPMEGSVVTDSSGKKTVLLPLLDGGDAIAWTYTLMCPPMGGDLTYTVYGSVPVMLMKINEQEVMSSEEGGFFRLDPEGEEKTSHVDWEGQGKFTVTRSWKKL